MINVLFVCHGNICRSTMAEFLFKYKLEKLKISDKFYVESAGTSNEEEGNGVHYGTAKILDKFNIDYSKKRAGQIRENDYQKFDYIIGMDSRNIINLCRYFNEDKDHKISLLLSYCNESRDVLDPWYTGNFIDTYNDIDRGLDGFLHYLGY